MDLSSRQEAKRILTTHVGSLPRPKDLLDLMKAKVTGERYDAAVYETGVRSSVAECVRRQVESGIDVVNDGEQSKPGFFTYIRERLEGFEPRPGQRRESWALEVRAFPEYYEQYFKEAMTGGAIAPIVPMVCNAPIRYSGEAALKRDIENLHDAVKGLNSTAVFMSSVAPG